MQLTDFARTLPEDVWALFEPILPPWSGMGTGVLRRGRRP